MIKKQDRRAFLRPLLLIVFLSALLPALTGAVQAAPVQADLFTLTERRNMAITVQYDRELPEIRFIAPDGAEYAGSGELSPGLFAEYRENAVCYRIPDAMPGSWSIVYDKLSNESLQVSYAPYSRDISIDGFALQSIEDGWATVDFAVSFAQDTRFSFVIYAVILQDNGNVSGKRRFAAAQRTQTGPNPFVFPSMRCQAATRTG
jgi:hypothetical protein